MPKGNVVSKAWVEIIPEMDGIRTEIDRELMGVEKKASKAGKSSGSGFAGSFKGAVAAVGGIVAAVGFADLISQAAEATDATQKFKSTLNFAGLGQAEIDALSKSTRAYADQTVYSLSDIQNVTAQLAANAVPNYDKLAEAAGNLNAVAGGNAETFQSVGMVLTQTAGAGKLTTENWNQLADAIPGASGKLQEAMKANGAYTGNFREAMEKGQISAEEFNQAIMELGMTDVAAQAATSTSTFEGAIGNLQAAVVGGLGDVMTQLQPAITGAINGVTSAITPMFSALSSGIGQVMDFVNANAPAMQQAFQPLIDAFSSLAQTVGPLVLPFLQQVGQLFQGLAPIIASVATTIVNVATQVLAVVMPIITQIVSFINANMPAIQALITSVMGVIQSVISAALTVIQVIWNVVWPPLSTVVSVVFGVISGIVSTVMGVIQGIIQVVTGIISGDWSKVWQGIQQVFGTIWNAIKGVVTGVLNGIKGFISGALNTIKGVWNSMWVWVSSFIGNIWNKVKTTVSNGVKGVVNFVKDIPNKIKNIFGNAGRWLLDAGKSIIDGLVKGIKNAVSGAVDAVKGVVGKIRDLFPFSPAKEGPFSGHGYTTWSGRALMTDWGKGMEDAVPAAVDYASRAASSVSSAISASASVSYTMSSSGAVSDGDETAKTITEWLDRNLPYIIENYTPAMTIRDQRRALGIA